MSNLVGSAEDGPVLRALGPGDVDLMLALEEEIFPEDPWTRGMVDEELHASGRHYVVAECDGTAVGYAGATTGSDADIMTIGVRESARGRGIGRILLEDLLRAVRAAGSQRVFLEVRASNEVALALYRGCGFSAIGRVRGYFRNPVEDAVTMRADVLSGGGAPEHAL